MNIENKPLSQRIQELQKAQQPKPVTNAPIETGLTKETFDQRKAMFEKQTQTGPKQESVVSKEVESELEHALESMDSRGIQQRQSQIKDVKPMLSYESDVEDVLIKQESVKKGSEGSDNNYSYESNIVLVPEQEKQVKKGTEGTNNNYSYESNIEVVPEKEKPAPTRTRVNNDDGSYSYESSNVEEPKENPLRDQVKKKDGSYDGNYESDLVLEPKQEVNPNQKYSQTKSNHYDTSVRQKTNVDGVEKTHEFHLKNSASNTAMLSSEEAQNENLLSFGKDGVRRGGSEERLSTQTDKRSLWAGSKPDRMIFAMSPEGKIYALDSTKPLTVKGQTVLDVRIHHSTLLGGKDLAGAGEIQVSAGLKPEELARLQDIVLKRVQEKLSKEKDLQPEVMQKLLTQMVDEELGRVLQNHQPGQVEVVSDRSGHYKPDLKMTGQVLNELEEQGVDLRRVNVELGDKTGNLDILEGELRVPAITVQSSQNVKDGETQLRGVHARQMNLHQELLSKVPVYDPDLEGVNENNSSSTDIEQRMDKLNQRLKLLVSNKEYDKAAVIYERLALMKGVKINPGEVLDGKNLQIGQEESILKRLEKDFSIPYSERNEVAEAYRTLIHDRRTKPETHVDPEVEEEDEGNDIGGNVQGPQGGYFNDKGEQIDPDTKKVIEKVNDKPVTQTVNQTVSQTVKPKKKDDDDESSDDDDDGGPIIDRGYEDMDPEMLKD